MIALILGCPLHPTYRANVTPGGIHGSATCKGCKKLFAVRNNVHVVMSTPREERDTLDDVLVIRVDEFREASVREERAVLRIRK